MNGPIWVPIVFLIAMILFIAWRGAPPKENPKAKANEVPCCHLDCESAATWEALENGLSGDMSTFGCDAHLGYVLGDGFHQVWPANRTALGNQEKLND